MITENPSVLLFLTTGVLKWIKRLANLKTLVRPTWENLVLNPLAHRTLSDSSIEELSQHGDSNSFDTIFNASDSGNL